MNKLKKNLFGSLIVMSFSIAGIVITSTMEPSKINGVNVGLVLSTLFTIGIGFYLLYLCFEAKKLKADREARKAK